MHWCNTWPHSIFASVILVDNKIMLWKVGQNTLRSGYWIDESKCSYIEKEFVVNNDNEHNEVFENQATEWFRQWKVHEDHRGCSPFAEPDFHVGDTICFNGKELEVVKHLKN